MNKILIHVFGTIILVGVGAFLFKLGIESDGIGKTILDFVCQKPVLYFLAALDMLVVIDAVKRKMSYAFLWGLGVLVLPIIALPLYLVMRSRIY